MDTNTTTSESESAAARRGERERGGNAERAVSSTATGAVRSGSDMEYSWVRVERCETENEAVHMYIRAVWYGGAECGMDETGCETVQGEGEGRLRCAWGHGALDGGNWRGTVRLDVT